jgi:DNA-binding LacI/PurR family transcriptional regulator
VGQAVASTGYRPNLLAQGLRSKSGNLIGLVVPAIHHETFASFVEYTERAVAERGYTLVVGNTHGEPDVEAAFIDGLLRRHVDGIVFTRVSDESRAVRTLARWKVPAVVMDRALEREDVPTVVLDNFRAGELAAEHLLGLGHRSLAVVTGPRNIGLSRERLRGFAAALGERGVALPARHVLEGDFKFASGVSAGRAIARDGLDVTAIWAQNDLMAVGVMNALAREGRRIPQELAVMGMDDIGAAQMIIPALTSVTQPFEAMCRQAVDLLFALRSGEADGHTRIALPPGLEVRESTAPPPRGPPRRRTP